GGLPTMPSLSMPSMSIGKITKKMGSVVVGIPALAGADPERRQKQEAEERKVAMSNVLGILDDVRLQCPQSHSGLILAYAGHSSAPILNAGIKFSWFRMGGDDKIDQLQESYRAWYPPSLDDIGHLICAQCEDNFGQGCSKYLEVSAPHAA